MASDSTFRLLHTADWHLGKMLGDLLRESEHQHFLNFLLEEIVSRDIDALLIAGDIFDSANPPQSAVSQYYNFLSALHRRSQCHVVVIAGNHDSPAQIEAPQQLLILLRTHVIGQWGEDPKDFLIPLPDAAHPRVVVAAVPFLRDRDLRVGISGQSPNEIQATLNQAITAIYQQVAASAAEGNAVPLLAMGHLTVTGATTSDSEREIHIGGLGALPAQNFPSEFCYIALGHLHRPQRCGTHEHIRYSGSPIPLSFSEANDHKELRLLEWEADGTLHQSGIPIPLTRRLLQKKCCAAEVESCLQELRHSLTGELLPAWIELTLADSVLGDRIANQVQELSKDAPFEVIRILQATTAAVAQTSAEFDPRHAEIDERLQHPESIFHLRLEQEKEIPDETKIALEQHFQALLQIHRGE